MLSQQNSDVNQDCIYVDTANAKATSLQEFKWLLIMLRISINAQWHSQKMPNYLSIQQEMRGLSFMTVSNVLAKKSCCERLWSDHVTSAPMKRTGYNAT